MKRLYERIYLSYELECGEMAFNIPIPPIPIYSIPIPSRSHSHTRRLKFLPRVR